jgi:magnesium transporter
MPGQPPSSERPPAERPPAERPPFASLRVAALVAGAAHASEGPAALAALAGSAPADPRALGAAVWVDLEAPSADEVAAVAGRLGLHPLIVEDIVEGNQRSKVEATDGLVHVVLFALRIDGALGTADIEADEIDLVLGRGFLLSVHPRTWDPRASAHFRAGPAALLRGGPDHVLWAIVDSVVDAYFPFTDRLEDEIDRLQDEVIERPDRATLARVFALKRNLIEIRRAVSPVREVLLQLTNRDLALIDAREVVYFRDVYDHTIRLTDEIDTDRELVAATLDVYLSTINNNLSAIMKRLTGVTVVLAGIGAIAGIFGMSEAGPAFAGGEATGFWVVALATVLVAALAAAFLRRIDWI